MTSFIARLSTPRNRTWNVSCAAGVAALFLLAGPVAASDLSAYRDMRLGMSMPVVAKRMELRTADAKTIHARPALIQELEWRANYTGPASPQRDPVGSMRFSFCNDALFRIVVSYDRELTRGMTVDDVVEAVSAQYGKAAATPADAEMIFPSLFNESVKILARWEDEHASVSLLRSTYQPAFGLVFLAKAAGSTAQAAIDEAIRLDAAEAPQREAERLERTTRETQATEQKLRNANKPNFRP